MSIVKVAKSLKHGDQYEQRYDESAGTVSGRLLETWIVEADSFITPVEAAAATDGSATVPTCGLFYTVGGTLFRCTRVFPQRETAAGTVWRLQVEYTEPSTTGTKSPGSKWEVDISIEGSKVQETVTRDRNGKAIVNSAKQAYQRLPSKTYSEEKITISYKTNRQDSAVLAGLRNRVNASPISFNIRGMRRTFKKRQLLLDDAKISTTFDGVDANTVWKTELVLIGRSGKIDVYDETGKKKTVDDTFVTRIMDEGMYRLPTNTELRDATATGSRVGLVKIKDLQGKEVTSPVPMDGKGRGIFGTFNPRYFTFEIEDEADLAPAFVGL